MRLEVDFKINKIFVYSCRTNVICCNFVFYDRVIKFELK